MARTKPLPRFDTPRVLLGPNPTHPGARTPQHLSAFAAWSLLTGAIAQTLPTQDVQVRRTIRQFRQAIR